MKNKGIAIKKAKIIKQKPMLKNIFRPLVIANHAPAALNNMGASPDKLGFFFKPSCNKSS
jgi:hypothetical protein